MNFEVDTIQKTITLEQGTFPFDEIDSLKKWIGDDWSDWKIVVNPKVVHQPNWIPVTMPEPLPWIQPYRPFPQYPGIGTPSVPYEPLKVWCSGDLNKIKVENASSGMLLHSSLSTTLQPNGQQ